MSESEGHVTALLAAIHEGGVDVSKIAQLKSYQKLLKLRKRNGGTTPGSRSRSASSKNRQEENNVEKWNSINDDNSDAEDYSESESKNCSLRSRGYRDSGKKQTKYGQNKLEETSRKQPKLKTHLRKKSYEETGGQRRSLFSWLLGIVFFYALFFVHQHQLLTHEGFSRFWLNWEKIDLHTEPVS